MKHKTFFFVLLVILASAAAHITLRPGDAATGALRPTPTNTSSPVGPIREEVVHRIYLPVMFR